ncbi:MAG TPA: 5-oxoprolinase subunit PxpA [Myxococcaceae bacterium]|nr:5-oxoprolinase subunit PxpA [Myxococcaceae bacterium]
MSIDLNADLGEGMDDAAIMPFLTSANIACAMHAGDPETMDQTVALALAHGLRIGAHPGYADRESFGRKPQQMSLSAVEALVLYQVAALEGVVRAHGGKLFYVKPHGALYNQAADDLSLARAIARGIQRLNPGLVLVGLAGSSLIDAARGAGLRVAEEAFADRRYLADGKLSPRSRAGSVLDDPKQAAAQALLIAKSGVVIAEDGTRISLRADTICLHGDTPGARSIALAIRQKLELEGVAIAPLVGRA